MTTTRKSAPPQTKIELRSKQIRTQDNPNVTIYAPAWVGQELQKLSDLIFSNDKTQLSISIAGKQVILNKPLKLTDLALLARNETANTSGVIKFDNYSNEFSNEVIYTLKDLVKHCVIVGMDKTTQLGGFKTPIQKLAKPKDTIVIDLAGLQFQDANNSGRLVLIPSGKDPLKKGVSDDAIFRNTVGEPQASAEAAASDPNRYIPATFHGKQVFFDRVAYQKFVAQDFLTAFNGLTTSVHNRDLNFKFLAYGTNFFADGLTLSNTKDKPERARFLEECILKGIKEALTTLLNSPEQLKNVKKLELPVYHLSKDNPLVKEIEELCKQANIAFEYDPKGDALKETPGLLTATTNCSDPHAPTGNEMGHQSVDAMIAENMENHLDHFNPALNTKMQLGFTPNSKHGVEPPAIEKTWQNWKHFATPKAQAEHYWKHYIQPRLEAGEKVAVIYAANQNQTNKLKETYTDASKTVAEAIGIGGGQAPFFAALGDLIEQHNVKNQVHILGVPTSKGGGPNTGTNITTLDGLNEAAKNIAEHIGAGFKVLGLGTINGANMAEEFALGAKIDPRTGKLDKGATSVGWMDPKNAGIYWDSSENKYKQALTDIPKEAISQGEYVEGMLQTMATMNPNYWPNHLKTAYKEGLDKPQNLTCVPVPKEVASPPAKETKKEEKEEKKEEPEAILTVDNPKPPTSERSHFLQKEKLESIRKVLHKETWEVGEKIIGEGRDQHVDVKHKTNENAGFSIYATKMKTESVEPDTYKAMLVSFLKVNNQQMPKITTYSREAQKAWIDVCKDLKIPNPQQYIHLAGEEPVKTRSMRA